ncbi:MAG: amino acid ABC transporter ATP-binding protein [Acholeplasmatales bacterium]|nr:MAG: amino acid ABC transporter ATP-binding protein [Acholeplasmatales bacterium]
MTLALINLTKDFGEGPILQDVSVVFNPGEITCIIGPSGSGKSTLLRMLNRLEAPTRGHIMVDGEPLKETDKALQRHRARTGMVFQAFHLFNHLSVLDNCMLAPITVLKLNKTDAMQRAMGALEEVDMAGYAHRRPITLSGGQKQRVAIARALSMTPQVLLFDEPTSALDPEMVQEVLQAMRRVVAKKITMILVTHEMTFAAEIADRILFMDEGQIIEDRPGRALLDDPEHPRTRQFLKSWRGKT